MSSVKICVSVIYCLCVYISLGDGALATIRVLKTSCYCSQNAVLQIAQNGLGAGAGGRGWGLQASAQQAGRSFLHPAAAAVAVAVAGAAGCGAAAKNLCLNRVP